MSDCPDRHRATFGYTVRQLFGLGCASLLFVLGLTLFLIGIGVWFV